MIILLAIFSVCGVVFIVASVPLIQQRVPPNLWYGLRTPATLSDTRIWYPANRYGGWRLLANGIAVLVVASFSFFLPAIDAGGYAAIVITVLIVGMAITVIQSLILISKLKKTVQV